MKQLYNYYIYIVLMVSLTLFQITCKKSELPENPYDGVNYNPDPDPVSPEPDPSTIQGLHKNIFSKKCALSGCHDGTFEPDFSSRLNPRRNLNH